MTLSLPVLVLISNLIGDDSTDLFVRALTIQCMRRAALYPRETQFARQLNLRTMNDDEFVATFRFEYHDLRRIARLLGLPKRIVTETGVTCNRAFAMAVLCGRLAYPMRDHQFSRLMQRGPTALRSIFYYVLTFVFENWGQFVTEIDPARLQPRLAEFASAIADAGSPYENCIGFLDGSLKQICRPSRGQREFYNGHKKFHCLAFQGFVTPDGLFASFCGGVPGAHHDQWVLRHSGLENALRLMNGMHGHGNRQYHLYADKGYRNNDVIVTPYRPYQLDPVTEAINAAMSRVRVSVEWMFGVLMSLWKFLGARTSLKTGSMPVTQLFIVSALLTNLHGCLYGNIVSDKFNVETNICEYLHVVDVPETDTDSDDSDTEL
jgi:nuclease HARBI1